MDFDVVITALMIGTALISARIAIKNRAKTWMIVQAVNLSVLALAWAFARDHVAVIAGPVWALSVLTPGIAINLADRAGRSERHGVAYAALRVAVLLHPNDPLRLRVLVAAVLRADRKGDPAMIAAALDRLAAHPAGGTLAMLLRWRDEGRWDEMRAYIEERPGFQSADPTALGLYLRALGELGDIETMLATFDATRNSPAFHASEDQALLVTAAFAGRVETTAMLLDRRHREMPDDVRTFWLLTSRHAAGEDVTTALRELGKSKHLRLGRGALARIEAPPAPPPSPTALRVLEAIDHEARIHPPMRPTRPTVSVPIVLFNLYTFAREVPGGTTDGTNLYELGALSLKSFQAGDWVRIGTATILHYGALHVAMNMLGILLFGPILEAAIGRWRALVVYVGSGLVANVIAVVIAKNTSGPGALLVGASGCAMGIIGALLVVRVKIWRKKRTPLAQAGVRSLAFIFFLQVVVDALMPRVAGSVHALGALSGALLALALGAPRWESVPQRKPAGARQYGFVLAGLLVAIGFVELAFAKTRERPADLVACEAGDADACARVCGDRDERWSTHCVQLARKLSMSPGRTREDEHRAYVTFEATCDAGSSFACTSLGVMIFNGDSVRADPEAARALWRTQCDGGEEAACRILAAPRD